MMAMFFFLKGYSQEERLGSARLLSPESKDDVRVWKDSLIAEDVALDTVRLKEIADSVMEVVGDGTFVPEHQDSVAMHVPLVKDSLVKYVNPLMNKRFVPDPKKSLWYAIIFPGGGQIYNRKYWKLPLIYGGFLGCIYAMNWNNTMYKSYAQAYLDITDDDPGTASYNKFLHLGARVTPQNEKQYTDIFKKRKDRYRRWRDLSFFVLIGVYALSVVDAYVDAELSVFDISRDLSLTVEPTVLDSHSAKNPIDSKAVGVQWNLKF